VKYLITTRESDGHGFGSNHWDDRHEFVDFESLVEYVAEIEFAKRNQDEIRIARERQEIKLCWPDPDNVEIAGIFETVDDGFREKMSDAVEKQVADYRLMFEKDKVDTAERQRESKEKRRRDKEEAERRRYEKLKAKYEGGES
jgi:hypothetical protein